MSESTDCTPPAPEDSTAERPGRLVVVYWKDIVADPSWCDGWESELEPVDCISVGWLRELDGYVHVIGSIDATNGTIGGVTAIPTECIRAILPLHEPLADSPPVLE